ncbi:Sphingomyelinase C 2 [Sphaceloma murrayae]|uniref:Sphingomyelinase C 2 n=1 Tax=Sphaceloma murrayae TaxID=2082308 RepID=A0A2K1QYE0_9PEZI|nr:Sphingomyelinase C 2 [Sphaceloma murrayae]
MAQPPGTPKSPIHDAAHHASYLPRDIPYSAPFEDSIADLLNSTTSTATRPIAERPASSSSYPVLDLDALPLAISDPRRTFPSPVPGLRLTHPSGYLEGGPGLSPSEDEFAAHFVSEHGIRDVQTLEQVKSQEIQRHIETARERARKRREAKEKNEGIDAEIRAMEEQLKLEMRVLGKARERALEKRETREKRKGPG